MAGVEMCSFSVFIVVRGRVRVGLLLFCGVGVGLVCDGYYGEG